MIGVLLHVGPDRCSPVMTCKIPNRSICTELNSKRQQSGNKCIKYISKYND